MDSFILGEDIPVICLTADSFPAGIEAAHEQLHQKVPNRQGRRFFGISRPDENGTVIYKAAAEEMQPGEAASLGLEAFTIKGGAYNTYYIKDFRDNIPAIAECFQLLIGQAEADPKGYCIEWYIGDKDVKCMVRSNDKDYPVDHTAR
jgi:predicted transcriptional regulator YdeE